MLGILSFETIELMSAQQTIVHRARTDATEYAGSIARHLFAQFAELEFIGVSLLAPRPDGTMRPTGRSVVALRRFMALHRSLYAFNIQSADGNTIVWSTQKQAARPITRAAGFTPLPGHPDYLLGRSRYAARVGTYAITMRFRAVAATGVTRYFVGTPYRLEQLLAYPNVFSSPWVLTTVDVRNRRPIGQWRGGLMFFPPNRPGVGNPLKPTGTNKSEVNVPGLPLKVLISWPITCAPRLWATDGWVRWIMELLVLVGIVVLTRQIEQSQRAREDTVFAIEHARRLDRLTGTLSRVGFDEQIIGLADRLAPGAQLAAFVIDICNFTALNKRLGATAGDRILIELAARLSALPGALLVARVGGDSFAFARIDPRRTAVHGHIETALSVAEERFRPLEGIAERLTLSLGCAIHGDDTEIANALLAVAEASLFGQVQRQSAIRRQTLDPYGDQAGLLLGWAHRFLAGRFDELAAGLLDHVRADQRNKAVTAAMTPQVIARFATLLPSYIEMLLDPGLTRAQHAERARQLGRLHAALGVGANGITATMSWLYQTITVMSQQVPGRFSQRQIYLDIVLRRIEFDLELQQEAAESLRQDIHGRMRELAHSLRPLRRRIDILDAVVAAFDGWPFIAFAAVYGQDPDGAFIVEAESDAHRAWFDQHPDQKLHGRRLTPASLHPMAEAWASGEPVDIPLIDGQTDQGPAWAVTLGNAGIRSIAALPVLDATGRILGMIKLYGRLPNLFRTRHMRETAEALSLLISRAIERTHSADTVMISADDRKNWREQLFNGGLRMFLQPIVDLASGTCTKFEALARIELANGQIISPGQFLPALSEQELDHLFVESLNHALDAILEFQSKGFPLDISVNLPPSTLRKPACVDWIRTALSAHRIDGARLTLELLEDQGFAGDDELCAQDAARLLELGVHLALDDLGAGYGSLTRLRALPFDILKIDQSLVRGISAGDRRSVPLVEGLVQMGRKLGIKVAIEGLETRELIDFARSMGAELGQGYGIAPPMAQSAVLPWLVRFAARSARGGVQVRAGAHAPQTAQHDDADDEAPTLVGLHGA
ncbi:EAL domain-containing protein [Acidiphilium sp. PA]|nr:EAL domain-containing protein [Acidiphilium sp. PA]MCW8306005.1 EAL domain-containing protein [Acidiphilium sp. PA]